MKGLIKLSLEEIFYVKRLLVASEYRDVPEKYNETAWGMQYMRLFDVH